MVKCYPVINSVISGDATQTAEATDFDNTIRQLLGDATLFFCAHDMDLVFNLADKILVLYYGKLIAEGRPEEIKTNPRVKQIYLGDGEA